MHPEIDGKPLEPSDLGREVIYRAPRGEFRKGVLASYTPAGGVWVRFNGPTGERTPAALLLWPEALTPERRREFQARALWQAYRDSFEARHLAVPQETTLDLSTCERLIDKLGPKAAPVIRHFLSMDPALTHGHALWWLKANLEKVLVAWALAAETNFK